MSNHLPKTTHGHAGSKHKPRSPEYVAWSAMKDRCRNPNCHAYRYYGGRGIAVCDQWLKFENFYADMGPKPSPLHSIDRINNDGNYDPGNCRWATKQEQCANRRPSPANIGLSDRARELGISRSRAWQIKQTANGKCMACPENATNGQYCEKHYVNNAIYKRQSSRRLHGFKPWRKGGPGRPPLYPEKTT